MAGIGRRRWASLALIWASEAPLGTSSGPTLGPITEVERDDQTWYPAKRVHRFAPIA